MPTKQPTTDVLHLPEAADFTAAEQHFARMAVGLSRVGAMFHGRLVEAHIGLILGASFPASGVAEWDLVTPTGVRIEVRTAGPGRAFSLRGTKEVDAWVFVTWDDELVPRSYRYRVMGRADVDQLSVGSKSVRAAVLDEVTVAVDDAGLAAAVKAAVRRTAAATSSLKS